MNIFLIWCKLLFFILTSYSWYYISKRFILIYALETQWCSSKVITNWYSIEWPSSRYCFVFTLWCSWENCTICAITMTNILYFRSYTNRVHLTEYPDQNILRAYQLSESAMSIYLNHNGTKIKNWMVEAGTSW